ncbi:unnamed protein product [Amoebophrya sp. A120]|nr:unnamed protein product [Amoebophrya sp. A120]|eukprot:GSA120T00014555001.1
MNSPRIKEFREEDRVQVGGPAAPSPDYNTKKTNYMFLLKAVPGVAEAAAPVEGSTRRARLVVSFLTLLLAVWVLWFYLDEVLGAGGSLLGTKMLAGVVWSWCGEKLSLLHGGGGDEIMFPTSHDLFAFRMKNEEDAHLASDFGGGDYDFLNLTKMNNTRSRMARMATRSSRSTSTSHSLVHDPFTTSFLAVSERTRTSTKRNKKISYARQEVELQKSSDETSTKTVTIKAREDQAGLLAQYVGAQGMPGTGQYDATTSSSCVHDCQDRWKLDLCSPHTWLDTPGFEDAAAAPGTTVIRSNKAPEDMLNWPSDHKLKVIFQAQAGPREFPGVPSDFYPPATDYHVVLTGPPDFRVRNKEGRPGFHVNGASAPSEQYGWTHQRARMKRVSRGQSGPTEQDDGEPVFVKIGLEQGLYGTTGDNNIDCWYNLVCEGKCPCDPTSESEFPAQVTAIAKTSYFGFAAVTRALTNQEHLDTPATAPRATEAQHTHAEFFQDLYQPNLAPVAVSLLGTSLVHVSDEQWSCRLELAPAVPQINHQPLWQFAHEHSTDEGLVDLMKRLYKDSVRHFRVMHRNGLYFPGCHAGNLQVITRTSEEAGGAAAPHEHLPYYNVAALDFSSVTYIPADFHLHSGERDITPSVPPGESKPF